MGAIPAAKILNNFYNVKTHGGRTTRGPTLRRRLDRLGLGSQKVEAEPKADVAGKADTRVEAARTQVLGRTFFSQMTSAERRARKLLPPTAGPLALGQALERQKE